MLFCFSSCVRLLSADHLTWLNVIFDKGVFSQIWVCVCVLCAQQITAVAQAIFISQMLAVKRRSHDSSERGGCYLFGSRSFSLTPPSLPPPSPLLPGPLAFHPFFAFYPPSSSFVHNCSLCFFFSPHYKNWHLYWNVVKQICKFANKKVKRGRLVGGEWKPVTVLDALFF